MKFSIASMTWIALSSFAQLLAQDGILDLTTLHNYANQVRPVYINRDNTPGNNAITDAGATLGRVMFYDKRLSTNQTISCASCHDQSRAFSDTATASSGVAGTTGRHAMRLINARFANESRFFWDERAPSLEFQTTQPIQDHVEMGFSGTDGDLAFADLVSRLRAIPEYRVLFEMTFGNAAINENRVQRSLAQFVRSIQSFDSKYDVGRAQANDNQLFPNFTASENAGKQIFLAPPGPGAPGQVGGGCAACHAPPTFDIDPNSLNNGVITSIGGGIDLTNTRSPSLRDLVGPGGQSNGGFMHNGGFATIAAVIDHYNIIPGDNVNLDPRLRRPGGVQNLNLTPTQKADLAAFLRTLTGSNVYTDEKWSNPFNAENELELIILPADAVTIRQESEGGAMLHCQAAPGLVYQMEASEDLVKWTPVGTMTSDADGVMEHEITLTPPSMYYRFTYTPPAL